MTSSNIESYDMKTTLTHLALAAALLLPLAAPAQTWTLPNKSGGKIVLTLRPCPDAGMESLLEAYAFSADGSRQAGCWAIFDGLVQIAWGQGRRSVFAQEDFTEVPERKPAAPKRPAVSL